MLSNPKSKIQNLKSAQVARAVEVGLEALRCDPVRTRAALVAMAIAMAIVVCLTTLVERGRAATIRALEQAGLKNLYLVQRHAGPPGALPSGRLTTADADKLLALVPARAVVAISMKTATWTAGGPPVASPFYAVAGPVREVFGMKARSGRLLAPLDVERKLPHAVVGVEVGRILARHPAAASIVSVGRQSYQVVGTLEETAVESASSGDIPSLDWNRAVVVPLGAETDAGDAPDARYPIDVAVLAFDDAASADEAARLAERFFSSPAARAEVRVASPIQTLRQYKQTRRTFDRIVWIVGLLTALSAVAGISNLLTASVVARSREIGLRRAVGARSSDIVLQFQAEGLLLGVLGGGAGLAAGVLISLATIDRSASGSSLSLVSFSGLALACVAIGIATGIRPSLRASRIDPAQALREG